MVLIHDEGVEALLPKVPFPAPAEVDHSSVPAMGFAEGVPQPEFVRRNHNEMHVIGHAAIGQNVHSATAAVFGEQPRVLRIVLVREERFLAAIAPLGHMVGLPPGQPPWEVWPCRFEGLGPG